MNNIMLIVDDLDINRDILHEMFKEGFTILEACNGEECLEIVKKYKRDIVIVLLDLFMPGIDGIEILKQRRGMDYFLEIPVVVITADNDIESQLLAFNLGATDYVTKPFVHPMVLYRIHNILSPRIQLGKMEREKNYYQVQAERDLLTELYNKGTTERMVEELLKKNQGLCALLIMDIDDFKKVNDVLGHLMGDHVIRTIAGVIASNFRQSDIVGRVGGDEFLVFMPEVPDEEAARKKTRELLKNIQGQCGYMLPMDISISIGLSFHRDAGKYTEMYRRSDEALYMAKERGKAQYAEYGVMAESIVRKKERVMLICSENRGLRRALSELVEEVQSIEVSTLQEMIRFQKSYGDDLRLLWIDISCNSEAQLHLLNKLSQCSEFSSIPYVALCAEGDMAQYRWALDAGAADIISMPLDEGQAKRRMIKLMNASVLA